MGEVWQEIKKYHLVENNVVILLLSKTLHETPFSIYKINLIGRFARCKTR